jgi:hypothetical protein
LGKRCLALSLCRLLLRADEPRFRRALEYLRFDLALYLGILNVRFLWRQRALIDLRRNQDVVGLLEPQEVGVGGLQLWRWRFLQHRC